MADRVHHIWYPLYDQPVTVTLSREQLQGIQYALQGRGDWKPSWNEYLADQIERVLKESLDD